MGQCTHVWQDCDTATEVSLMPRAISSETLSIGMVGIPVKIAKASDDGGVDLSTLCSCGGEVTSVDDPVVCKDCGERYSWWTSVPDKGFEVGDEIVHLDGDDVKAAREEPPVDTGTIEKAAPLGRVMLHYNTVGNYYLLPEEGFEEQYGALVGALNELDVALLTYVQLRTKTQRYAIISEGGVLLALQLADKKAIPDLEYEVDETTEAQAEQMIEGMVEDDPALDRVEGEPLRELIREQLEQDGFQEAEAPEIEL